MKKCPKCGYEGQMIDDYNIFSSKQNVK